MRAYSLDLRERVIKYIEQGHSKAEAGRVYGVSWKSVLRWTQRAQSNMLAPFDNKMRRAKKLKSEELKAYIHAHPDATLKEIGEHFNAAASSVYTRIKNFGFTYKKKSFYTKSVMSRNAKGL